MTIFEKSYIDPSDVTGFVNSIVRATEGVADNITAHAGTSQTGATPLTAYINRVTTVASIGDSVILPAPSAGLDVLVINATSKALSCFPQVGGTINNLSTNTHISVPAYQTGYFVSTNGVNWYTVHQL